MRWGLLLLSLLAVWCHAKSSGHPNDLLIELKSKLASHEAARTAAADRARDVAQGQLSFENLKSTDLLSSLVEEGGRKLAATRVILDATPAAATPAAASASGMNVDLIQPPQLQPLALPSFGPQPTSIDELADIQREEVALRQKKLTVAQQKRIIQESEDSAAKLAQLIAVNKQISQRNDAALVAANQHLTDRIKAYGDRLAQEASATGSAGAAAGTTAAALIEQSGESREVQSVQLSRFEDQMRDQMQRQADTIQRLEDMVEKRRHRRRRRSNIQGDDNETSETKDNSKTTKPVTS